MRDDSTWLQPSLVSLLPRLGERHVSGLNVQMSFVRGIIEALIRIKMILNVLIGQAALDILDIPQPLWSCISIIYLRAHFNLLRHSHLLTFILVESYFFEKGNSILMSASRLCLNNIYSWKAKIYVLVLLTRSLWCPVKILHLPFDFL